MRQSILLFLTFITRIIALVPSIEQVASDVTILTDNDRYHNLTTRTSSALLLSQFVSYSQAIECCALLGERLWSPAAPGQTFSAGMNSSLAYQVSVGSFGATQKFWVSHDSSKVSNSKARCSTIDTRGRVSSLDCAFYLPILCTQSAPISMADSTNPSTAHQITVVAGKQNLTGFRDLHTFQFLGVRFAPKPQRFGYSQLFSGTESMTAFQPGPECVQPPSLGSEDCLFLNVWTPSLPSSHTISQKRLRAVMVWIFGGGFATGAGYNAGTDGSNLASRGDVVVVSLNYRLGNLGFLALKDGVTNGNYGIQDIITALQWIKNNIKAFGGDPKRVTVFGQSAGAAAIRALLASPKAKGLFAAAIMQSNPVGFSAFNAYSYYASIEQQYANVTWKVLSAAGCLDVADQLACLRGKDAYELANLPIYVNSPVMDGTYLVSPGLFFNGEGYTAHVPVLTGTVRDEGGITAPYPVSDSLSEALNNLSTLLGLNMSYIPATGAFPVPSGPDVALNNFNVTSRIVTDGGLHCLGQATAYSGVINHVFPSVYSYIFNRTYQPPDFTNAICSAPVIPGYPFGNPDKEYFKCHAGEVAWEFGTLMRTLQARDDIDVPFSQLVVDYWSSFARTHDPNPHIKYLVARGYWNTIAQLEAVGRWEEVIATKPAARWLQWNGKQLPFDEEEQCNALGLPLDYFEEVK